MDMLERSLIRKDMLERSLISLEQTSRRMHALMSHSHMKLLAPPSLNCLPPNLKISIAHGRAVSSSRDPIWECMHAYGNACMHMGMHACIWECMHAYGNACIWEGKLERPQPRRQRACLELRQAGGTGWARA